MTCNPFWDEILKMMSFLPACNPEDCPDIIARVFELKLDQLYDDIKKKYFFGKYKSVMYVVEYQKRRLPHTHMLIWIDETVNRRFKATVDNFICAEVPDENKDSYGYAAVKLFMIHGPCGAEFDTAPCMKGFKCSRNFPKMYSSQTIFDEFGFPIYRRRKIGYVVNVKKVILDNQWVVPYNRDLLVRYKCHINLDACNHGRCMKYVFKYYLKGPNKATLEVRSAHRIFGFDIYHRSISVERLQKYLLFDENQPLQTIIENVDEKKSKLEAFFELCQNNQFARTLTYQDVPEHFVWNRTDCQWQPRKQGEHYGRLNYGHYSTGELWYLRILLPRICGPTSFEELRTVDGVVYKILKKTCATLGLLNDDKEWHEAISENATSEFPFQLCALFVHIIVNCQVTDVYKLWKSN